MRTGDLFHPYTGGTMRYTTSRATVVTAMGVLSLILVACGGNGPDGPGAAAVTEMPFDVATAGSVQGEVSFEGTPPPPTPLNMESEPSCLAQYDDPPVREDVRVRDGRLAEVFVYVKEGLEDMAFPLPAESVLIDQEGCRYVPRVSGAMTNQTITLRNSDGLLHNINASPQVNRPFNISQPVNMDTERTFPLPEVMIPLRCDVHGWMGAYVGIVPHPYHAVTGDNGAFSLDQLPPGEYLLEAWHPTLGSAEERVTVTTGETATVSFTFSGGSASRPPLPPAEPEHAHIHVATAPAAAIGR